MCSVLMQSVKALFHNALDNHMNLPEMKLKRPVFDNLSLDLPVLMVERLAVLETKEPQDIIDVLKRLQHVLSIHQKLPKQPAGSSMVDVTVGAGLFPV
jgi:hypothetical protein